MLLLRVLEFRSSYYRKRNEGVWRMLRLISSAELEMHGVASASLPVASPFESSFSEHRNHGCVHVAGCSLLIRLRIQINSDAPRVGRKLGTGALRPKRKTSAEAGDLVLQSAALNVVEGMAENIRQELVAGNRAHGSRVVPRQCNGKWQCDTDEKA